MLPRADIVRWRAVAPWADDDDVEQDLVITLALFDVFRDEGLKAALAFRGGTALHKLYLAPAARYSEDIDLVQREPGPIGPTLSALRRVLGWIGPARSDTTEHPRLTFRFETESGATRKHDEDRTDALRLFCCPAAPGRTTGDLDITRRGQRRDRRDAFATRDILERVTDPHAPDETRVDRWLCAVRLVKTRPLASRLCEGGHVLVNGTSAKPSTKVRAGDRVEALIAERERVVEVTLPIESRVGAAVAATCYIDHSPPVVPEAGPTMMPVRGEGRPSKRLRRELERLRRAADA